MPVSEARKRANVEYNRRQDSITMRPKKQQGAAIRAAAAASGESLQKYILHAVQERMTREGAAARNRPGGIRGRRGTIGGYWGEF